MADSTRDGGKPVKKDLEYCQPVGPTGLIRDAIGLGGDYQGNHQKPTLGSSTGSPGNHGTNYGCKGTQGRY